MILEDSYDSQLGKNLEQDGRDPFEGPILAFTLTE
jgi:hypothetical protein